MIGSILNGLQIGAGTNIYTYSTTNTLTTTNQTIYTCPSNAYAEIVCMKASVTISGTITGNDCSWRVTNSSDTLIVLSSTSATTFSLGKDQADGISSTPAAAPIILRLVAGDVLSFRHTSVGGGGTRSISAVVKVIEYTT